MELFLDTCVLLNYTQVWVEGDKGSVAIFENSSISRTIGETTETEFERRCSSRRTMYSDLLKFISNYDETGDVHPIYEYETLDFEDNHPSKPVTENDKRHLRELQMSFASIADEDVLYELRKYIRSVKSRKKKVDQNVNVCQEPYDPAIVDELSGYVSNSNDCKVIAQGVAWKMSNNPTLEGHETLVTLDNTDIISNADDINQAITDAGYQNGQLNIATPNNLSI